jgi:copper chaperone CopZ
MKTINLFIVGLLFLVSGCNAQIDNAKTETVKVYGNCGMCEETIEKAGTKKKEYKTDWNVDSKMATITFDSTKTTLDAVLKSIALAGYDNKKYLAPDEVYNKLHGCCQYDREKKGTIKTEVKDTVTAIIDHSAHTSADTLNVKQESNQLKPVFDNYFAIKDALVKTDGPSASIKAASLVSSLKAVKMEALGTEEHNVWMKVMKDLIFDAEHIAETKDVRHQRDYFTTLSKNMYLLIKAANTAEKVYYQNCPMYNEGKGANWLSKESTIKNPYYGKEMLTCGKTIETIK